MKYNNTLLCAKIARSHGSGPGYRLEPRLEALHVIWNQSNLRVRLRLSRASTGPKVDSQQTVQPSHQLRNDDRTREPREHKRGLVWVAPQCHLHDASKVSAR